MVKTKRKIVPNKASMKEKYVLFFNTTGSNTEYTSGNPEQKSEILYKYIYIDNLEFKEDTTISMTYSKDFREQFKGLSI